MADAMMMPRAAAVGGLDAGQRFAFECAGFLLLPAAISPEAVQRLLRASAPHRCAAYAQFPGLLGRDAAFAEALFHPLVTAVSTQFFGSGFTLKDSVLVFNPARIGGDGGAGGMRWPAWHRDADHGEHPFHAVAWPCPLFQLRFFIALTATTGVDSGGLALYPGSHGAQGDFPFAKDAMPPGAVVPVMSAGDCLIMHHATRHTALPNRSDHDRFNLQIITTPNWIRSKEQERTTPELLARLPEEHRKRVAPSTW
jgi:ectoine hydroxylase-related dioxygenase (phytanoyl-CoA dioxygenase family)